MPIFNHEKLGRVLFIHIPKTGGSSVERMLIDAGYELDKLNFWDGTNFQHAIPAVYNTWGNFHYKFTVVREPMERFCSAIGYRGYDKNHANQAGINAINGYYKHATHMNNHIRPQVDFLSNDVDIYHLEDNFLEKIARKLDIVVQEYPHENAKKQNVTPEHISDVLKKRVYNLYEKDYAEFGYPIR